MAAVIPETHNGLHYYEFMAALSKKRDVRRYLEIGVNEGGMLSRIHADVAVGVDPAFVLSANVAAEKKVLTLIQETSDRFFANYDYAAIAGGKPEFCFLDGFHTFEFLLRDFINTEAICSRNSLICLHDCMPLNHSMTIRNVAAALEAGRGTPFDGWWTGDVWKIVPILKEYRPDLKLVMVDCAPTGIVCITNLAPTNKVLESAYLDIVERYRRPDDGQATLEAYYDRFEITPAATILEEMDNTLFFRT